MCHVTLMTLGSVGVNKGIRYTSGSGGFLAALLATAAVRVSISVSILSPLLLNDLTIERSHSKDGM